MRPLHFISGLPRSGSTLLAGLLRQNPRFHAHMSSPLAGLVRSLLERMSVRNEFAVFATDAQRERVLRGVFEQYYGPEFTAEVILDTNRDWCARMPLLQTLFPASKVIACVREVPWIVDSIEQLVRRNVFSPSSIFNYLAGGTVYSRSEAVANGDGMLGFPYNALKEAFYGEHTQHLLLLQYETLVTEPGKALQAVYDFIGEKPFKHNMKRVEFDAREFDEKAGTPGLHDVRPVVGAKARQTVLPPDVFRRFENDAFWRDPQRNPHKVQIV